MMNNSFPSTHDCENFLEYASDHLKSIDIARSRNATESILRKMATANFNGYEYLIRIAILENPNCPEDLALSLMRNAVDIKERDKVFSYWQRKYEVPDRDNKFKVVAKPEFPTVLLDNSLTEIDEIAKRFFAVMPAIAEFLWFELASKNLVPLAYWADEIAGDTFGLMGWRSEFDSQVYRVLGRGYFTDWIERDGHISLGIGFDKLADEAEEVISWRDWADETCDGEPYPASLLGYAGAYGDLMNHLTLNLEHPRWQEIVDEVLDDETILEFDIKITGKPDWIGPTWGELSSIQQVNFVTNIEKLLPHPYLGEWGFIRHFFSLFEIHPGTKPEALNLISDLLKNSNKAVDDADLAKELIDKAEAALANLDFTQAEQLLIDAHEQAKSASTRDLASIMLIEKILMPKRRLIESEMWCKSVISTSKRKELREKVFASDGAAGIIRVTEQNLWQNVDISGNMQQTSDQQYHFNRLVQYLSSLDTSAISRDTMSTWPGPGFTGLLGGLWEEDSALAQLGCLRETAAAAAFDFLNYVSEEPLGAEERAPVFAEAPYAGYSDDELLKLSEQNDPWALKEYGLRLDRSGKRTEAINYWRRAADLGNHPSLRNLGVVTMQNDDPKVAAEFFKRAIEFGSRTAFHGLADAYEEFAPELVVPTLLEGVKHGDVVAMNNLGVKKQNEHLYSEAAVFYRRAAEYGDLVAAANLANMLALSSNFDESRIWLERAEDDPDPKAMRILESVRSKINANDVNYGDHDEEGWDDEDYDEDDDI